MFLLWMMIAVIAALVAAFLLWKRPVRVGELALAFFVVIFAIVELLNRKDASSDGVITSLEVLKTVAAVTAMIFITLSRLRDRKRQKGR